MKPLRLYKNVFIFSNINDFVKTFYIEMILDRSLCDVELNSKVINTEDDDALKIKMKCIKYGTKMMTSVLYGRAWWGCLSPQFNDL